MYHVYDTWYEFYIIIRTNRKIFYPSIHCLLNWALNIILRSSFLFYLMNCKTNAGNISKTIIKFNAKKLFRSQFRIPFKRRKSWYFMFEYEREKNCWNRIKNKSPSLWLGIKFHYLSYKTTILLLMFPTCCLQYFIIFAFKIIQIGKTFLVGLFWWSGLFLASNKHLK